MSKTSKVSNANAILEGLDKFQYEAAKSILGPIAIKAGAGAGKTRTITHRIAYACRTGEWLSDHVLAITFTTKAAKEMRERLSQLSINNATVNTFHAQALSQIREYWPKTIGTEPPQLRASRFGLVEEVVKNNNLELNSAEISAIADEIGWCKVSLVPPSKYQIVAELNERNIHAPVNVKTFSRIYDEYDNLKSEEGLVDFEDIILLMIHLIDNYESVATSVRDKIRHIIVDEFQDVSPLQYKYLRSLLGNSREICVVGDPSQTIYSFTGATPHYLINFEEYFKPKTDSQSPVKEVELLYDYRSTPQIVELANKILKYRGKEGFKPLKLMSKAQDIGENVHWNVYPSDRSQVINVCRKISELIKKRVYSPSEIAILTRTNALLIDFGNELRRNGIECYIKQEKKGPEDEIDEEMQNAQSKHLTQSGVTLASLHSAKGLEWECVFLACLAQGQMPLARVKDEYNIEEERRLLYVGVTRAKKSLYMSYALAKEEGNVSSRSRSRFLDRIWPA